MPPLPHALSHPQLHLLPEDEHEQPIHACPRFFARTIYVIAPAHAAIIIPTTITLAIFIILIHLISRIHRETVVCIYLPVSRIHRETVVCIYLLISRIHRETVVCIYLPVSRIHRETVICIFNPFDFQNPRIAAARCSSVIMLRDAAVR